MHKKVLIVEDDRDIRDALGDALTQAGHQVFTAVNGSDALDFLSKGPTPDVILLDLMMPVMNGQDFLEHQSGVAVISKIPVVVMSAAGNLLQGLGPQVRHCVKKPLNLEELIRVIGECCCAG